MSTLHEDPRVQKALDQAIELGDTGLAVAAYHHGERGRRRSPAPPTRTRASWPTRRPCGRSSL